MGLWGTPLLNSLTPYHIDYRLNGVAPNCPLPCGMNPYTLLEAANRTYTLRCRMRGAPYRMVGDVCYC